MKILKIEAPRLRVVDRDRYINLAAIHGLPGRWTWVMPITGVRDIFKSDKFEGFINPQGFLFTYKSCDPQGIFGQYDVAATYTCIGMYKGDLGNLPASIQEFLGIDPIVSIPVKSYFVFGSGSLSVSHDGEAAWLEKYPLEDWGHNGFWGLEGIACRLSEVPKSFGAKTNSYPGGQCTYIRPA